MSVLTATNYSLRFLEQLDELFGELDWSTEYRQLSPGNLSTQFRLLDGGGWFVLDERSSQSVEVQAPAPADMYVIALVERGAVVINRLLASPGDIIFVSPDSEFRATLPADVSVTQIGIHAAQFEELFSLASPDVVLPRGVLSLRSVNPGSARVLRTWIFEQLLNSPNDEPAVDTAVLNSLMELVALAFSSENDNNKNRHFIHSASAIRALTRAVEYIDAHLHEPVRVQDLCGYAGTNPRFLQRIFLKEFGVPPQDYLKALRLNAARRALLEAREELSLGVTEIALSCGFTHLGRFSQDYRRHFGELPRETIRPV